MALPNRFRVPHLGGAGCARCSSWNGRRPRLEVVGLGLPQEPEASVVVVVAAAVAAAVGAVCSRNWLFACLRLTPGPCNLPTRLWKPGLVSYRYPQVRFHSAHLRPPDRFTCSIFPIAGFRLINPSPQPFFPETILGWAKPTSPPLILAGLRSKRKMSSRPVVPLPSWKSCCSYKCLQPPVFLGSFHLQRLRALPIQTSSDCFGGAASQPPELLVCVAALSPPLSPFVRLPRFLAPLQCPTPCLANLSLASASVWRAPWGPNQFGSKESARQPGQLMWATT